MSKAFLIFSIVFTAVTLNALRPIPISMFSFFSSWLTKELAPQLLIANAGFTIWFAVAGAVEGTIGWVALGFNAVTVGGLLWLIGESVRVKAVTEDALRRGLGDDYATRILPHKAANHDLKAPWRQMLLPFYMRHPDVERTRNIPYGPVKRRNLLDVYRHKDHPTGAPVLLFIHGGAWTISNKDQQGKPIMLHFASRGWVCFASNYRMSPRSTWPAHIEDVKKAIAWIREHGAEYGADPDFIMITGGSAGGHLTALAATSANDPAFQPGFEDADTSLQAAVPHYGIYDMTDHSNLNTKGRLRMLERVVFKKKYRDDPEVFRQASPLHRAGPDAPPFLVIHGAHDNLAPVTEARRFAERLREVSGDEVVYAELPGTQHAFDVFPSIRTAHVVRAVERFADYVYSAWLRDRGKAPAEEPARR
ncbi:MAG: alpha/beta hydrolase fold domain-containing protein [Actinomycetota bacterium]